MPLTHELLVTVLEVHCPGVTEAIHVLEGRKFVETRCGHMVVVDRTGLEKMAGISYGVVEAENAHLIGPLKLKS